MEPGSTGFMLVKSLNMPFDMQSTSLSIVGVFILFYN